MADRKTNAFKPNYGAMSILIADDFSSFRNTVFGMLQKLGVNRVDTAGSAAAVLDICQRKTFDIILCDYNLGAGKTGQHVLEELRFRHLLPRKTIFIMVSAEAARTIVMSAYDCEPDDYLMKPITAGMLQARMNRLLMHRYAFKPVMEKLDKGDRHGAIDLLIDMSIAEDRHAVAAQKILGELFIEEGQLDKAERLYTRALEIRQVDWARLGLAKVKKAREDYATAETWLEKIVNDNPLFLPAYDTLAENFVAQSNYPAVQTAIQRSVAISPMSIQRQQRLTEVATRNNDLITAFNAARRSVKLAELSCYGTERDSMALARSAAKCIECGLEIPAEGAEEALASLERAKEKYHLEDNALAQVNLLCGSLHAARGEKDLAKQYLESAGTELENAGSDIDTLTDYLALLISLGETEKAEALIEQLKERFAGDEAALQKLDVYLNEPASEANRAMVAAVNRDGIELYNQHRYDEALACFEKARQLFPRHVGLQLNIVQALIGKLRSEGRGGEVESECQESLRLLEPLVGTGHPQFERYQKLRRMALSVRENV